MASWGNTRSNIPPGRKADWDEADAALARLPKRLKEFVLFEASLNWHPAFVLKSYRRLRNIERVIDLLRRMERDDLKTLNVDAGRYV